MARLLQRPTKYTPEEWHRSNHMNYNSAERERQSAEVIRDESNRLKHEINITTIKTQSDVNKKLDQRLQDITFWKSELDRLHGESEDEINELLRYKERLEKALDATQLPLHVAKQCLGNREERVQIDLVHDDVEIQLLKVAIALSCFLLLSPVFCEFCLNPWQLTIAHEQACIYCIYITCM